MKRILCMVLCVMMVLSLLAGCGGETTPSTTKHNHSWANTWSTNETQHWKACTSCGVQAMMGAHMDDDKDGVCNDCGYVETCTHTFDENTWMTDAENHWHPASCKHEGVKGSEAAHVDADNNGVCDVCEYQDGEHQHTYHPEWSSNEAEHWHEASCGHSLVSDKANHVDPENDGECDVCGWFDATHTHTFADGWTTDAGYHWNGATCEHTGAVQNIQKHDDQNADDLCDVCGYVICHHADFDVDGVCDICGYEDREHDHNFGQEWLSDHNGHWKAAQCHPGAVSAVEAHQDKDNNGNCDICAYVICSHVYKKSWSSNDTHHWYQLLCTCSVETRKEYGEHVDADGINGCDICMHGFQAVTPVEVVVDKQKVTIDPNAMLTWTEVSFNIPKPGRYLVTSDSTDVRWYTAKDQDPAPTSYASEVYFAEAGTVTMLAQYFDFNFSSKQPFDIHLTVTLIDDLLLNSSRGKAELPTNMIYKVVFQAMQTGVWTLQTSVPNVSMGLTMEEMELATSVEISVDEVGDLVELYVLVQDDASTASTFLFDWELVVPFQLDVTVGKNPVSVPAEGDDYKVVFTAPEDGRFLLMVTNEELSFSEWGLGGQNKPVRTESIQQLTPYMKAGETFTTWIQTVYNYALSTNVNDTLTIINVGTLLETDGEIGDALQDYDTYEDQTYTAPEDGQLTLTVYGGQIGVVVGWNQIMWLDMQTIDGKNACQVQQTLAMGESFSYYVRPVDMTVEQSFVFVGESSTEVKQPLHESDMYNVYEYTATNVGEVTITVTNGIIGLMNELGQIQWMQVQEENGQMISKLVKKMAAEETLNYVLKSVNQEQGIQVDTAFYNSCPVTPDGALYSFTAKENSYYGILVMDGEIGVTTNGVTRWVAGKMVDGRMVAVYEVKLEAGVTYVFQIRGENEMADVNIKPVYYQMNLDQMFDKDTNDMNQMGKDHSVNMVPSKVYDIVIPDTMMKLRVKLSWNYKGVTVYVDGQEYQMGTEIYLQDVKSITARLRNNVALDVTFTLTVTYAPVKQEAVTEGEMSLNKDMEFLVTEGGYATASYTAAVGGTYILTSFTPGARIYILNEMGEKVELVISDGGNYTFQLEADETVQFVIYSANGEELTVQLTLTAPRA